MSKLAQFFGTGRVFYAFRQIKYAELDDLSNSAVFSGQIVHIYVT